MKGTKDLILKTAKKLFTKKGLTKTSMDDIAADAKIGKGTIYHYYDSKEKLFIEIAERESELLGQKLVASVPKDAGAEEKLRVYMLGRFKLVVEISNIFSMFKDEYVQYYSYIKKVEEKFKNLEQDVIKQILKEGVEQKIFAAPDIDFMTFTLMQIQHSMEYYFALPENRESLEKKLSTILDMLIYGIKKRT